MYARMRRYATPVVLADWSEALYELVSGSELRSTSRAVGIATPLHRGTSRSGGGNGCLIPD